MFDIWGFLLQTLTVSGVAALILVIKVLFKNKLFPKWQFAVWSVLGIMMLLPAGLFGRYTLFYWQVVLEIIKSWLGKSDTFSSYSSLVIFPFNPSIS